MHHRELVDPPALLAAPGFGHIAIASGTKVVHLAGQVGLLIEIECTAVVAG